MGVLVSDPIIEHLKSFDILPAEIIEAVVGFSGTATTQFSPDLVHQSLLDWRGDLERYLLEQLDAAEVILDMPTERVRLIVPGHAQEVGANGQGLPFFFRSQLALLPTELERLAPRFGEFIANLTRAGKRDVGRAHLERAMAITVWACLRLAIDDNVAKSRDLIASVSADGVDLIWRGRPTLSIQQSLSNLSLIVTGAMNGELVPKRKVTIPVSYAKH